MEVKEQPKLSFKGVDIIDLSFKQNSTPTDEMTIEIECNPVALISEEMKDTFNILMDLHVFSEEFFDISLKAIGYFKLSNLAEESDRKNLINVNAAAIMFPYIRSFITTLTANLGRSVGTLVLPPQFFKGEIEIKEI